MMVLHFGDGSIIDVLLFLAQFGDGGTLGRWPPLTISIRRRLVLLGDGAITLVSVHHRNGHKVLLLVMVLRRQSANC
jgi:hypothetical protein